MSDRKAWQHHDSRHARGYGARWMKLRARVLGIVDGQPTALCRDCQRTGRVTIATDCDHIVPKSKQGTDDLDNLQPLCRKCHEAKTARENGRTVRRRVGLDGYPVG